MTGIQTACTLEERAHIDKMRADYNQYLVALRCVTVVVMVAVVVVRCRGCALTLLA